jgi:hypothetical protein
VTALIAWPGFRSERAEPQGDKQMAAPAEPRTPNLHRAKRIAPRECGWKHGDSGHSAGERNGEKKKREEKARRKSEKKKREEKARRKSLSNKMKKEFS